jgi:hypothetical protein
MGCGSYFPAFSDSIRQGSSLRRMDGFGWKQPSTFFQLKVRFAPEGDAPLRSRLRWSDHVSDPI